MVLRGVSRARVPISESATAAGAIEQCRRIGLVPWISGCRTATGWTCCAGKGDLARHLVI